MSNIASAGAQFLYEVVDVETDSTTVYDGKCILSGIYVDEALSAHALPIKDGTSTVFNIPASTAAGNWFPFGDVTFQTSLVVDPDNAADGVVVAVYAPAQ